ncbi:Bcr/CflA family multidrug efflux MFS transporter [Thorsellia kenyensis]|uniref:Bcr/CflA family efflux transporter n=1 Tax=Thorsellia kenyensis TaxID=1549888 RepID=A0ABV6CGE5_9GAMM
MNSSSQQIEPNNKDVEFFRKKRFVLLLGIISMLMPLAVDLYLSAIPAMAKFFQTTDGHVQITLSSYILGFALGQLIYGPISDSIGRRPIIIYGILSFALISIICGFVSSIQQLILLRFFHGFVAASAAVVINALLRDIYENKEFSRMFSMVLLVSNIAPLTAPLLGGWILLWFNWQAIFWVLGTLSVVTLFVSFLYIKETLKPENKQRFSLRHIRKNFYAIVTNRAVFFFILTTAFSFAGMFAFITAGSSVYIGQFGISEAHFGYYFGLNVLCMMLLNITNTRLVKHVGVFKMFCIGISLQASMGLLLIIAAWLKFPFIYFVFCISGFVGSLAMVNSNAMAMIMDKFPNFAGTASSLTGTFRFGVAALVGMLLARVHTQSVWPMVLTMSGCAFIAMLFALIAIKSVKK